MTGTQRGVIAGVLLAVGVAAGTLVAVSSSGQEDDASASVESTPSTSSTASTAEATTSSTAASAACAPGGPTPRGDVAPDAADLDGDGAADTVYMLDQGEEGVPTIGVTLANGHSTETPYEGMIAANVYGPTDLDANGRHELFVVASGSTASTTRVQLALLEGCELVLARNVDGEPYVFLVSDQPLDDGSGRDMAGVGCTDVAGDGVLDLVGLAGYEQDAAQVRWSRTVVDLTGAELRNGAVAEGVFTRGADDAAIASLGQASCGDDAFDEEIVSDVG